MTNSTLNRIIQTVESLRTTHSVVGLSLALTDSRSTLLCEGFGLESAERPSVATSPDAMYRIASISKVVTGVTLLRLCELGLLDLDLPITDCIGRIPHADHLCLDRMTLRKLMSHTAGLPVEYTPDGPREESALESSLVDGLPKIALAHDPDDVRYLYSNWGIRLASYAAQRVTGRYFTDLAYEYAIKPLGMTRTTYDLHDAATYPLSLPHTRDGKVVHHLEENAARHAAGGLYSNVGDLCKLMRMFMNGGKSDSGESVLSEASMREMTKVHANENDANRYCLTLMEKTLGDRVVCGHTGSAEPYASSVFVDIERGIGVALLMNTYVPELRTEIPREISDILK